MLLFLKHKKMLLKVLCTFYQLQLVCSGQTWLPWKETQGLKAMIGTLQYNV